MERIFFTLEGADGGNSYAAKVTSFVLIFAIVISITVWMISTHPEFREIQASCDVQVDNCPPLQKPFFDLMEKICVFVFTLEYVLKLLTVCRVHFELFQANFIEALLTEKMSDCRNGAIDGPILT